MPLFQILCASSGSTRERGPYARLVGRTSDGRSVVVTIRGLFPHFYVRLDGGLLTQDGRPNEDVLAHLEHNLDAGLNRRVHASEKHPMDAREGPSKSFVLVKSRAVQEARDYYGFSTAPKLYAKFTFSSLGAHRSARFMLSSIAKKPQAGQSPPLEARLLHKIFPAREADISKLYAGASRVVRKGIDLVLAEANIAFHDQCMDALGLKPGGWCELDRNLVQPDTASKCAASLCCLARPFAGRLADALRPAVVDRASPVRVLAWDLEVFCKPLGGGAMKFYDGDHPEAQLLCVSAVSFQYGVANSTQSVVFALGSSNDPQSEAARATDGSALEIRWFANEKLLLGAFVSYIREQDIDILTGWNTLSFDWPWLYKRAKALKMLPALELLARWGAPVFDNSDKAWQVVALPGRVVHDMMAWVKKNRQLREYNLQYVATEFGLDGKDDVSYSDIAELSATHDGRVRLAVYCELDSRLVVKLMQHPALDPLGKTLAISALTGVSPEDLLFRGSMHTLRLALLRASHSDGFLLSCPTYAADDGEDAISEVARYQGAHPLP
jgi:DNA polymerase elongation subunit (family B)